MDCRSSIFDKFKRFYEEHASPIELLLIFSGVLYFSDIQLKSFRKADLKSSSQVKILYNLQVLASVLLPCGYLLEFSSKLGRLLIAAASAISTSIFGSVAYVKGIEYQSTSLKKEFDGRPETLAPIIHLFGSLFNLIALLSISNDKMSMLWLGLLGSFSIYIGGLLNVLEVYKMHRIKGGDEITSLSPILCSKFPKKLSFKVGSWSKYEGTEGVMNVPYTRISS